MTSSSERDTFRSDGFVVSQTVVSASILDRISTAPCTRRAGTRHMLSNPVVAQLAQSQPLVNLAATLADAPRAIPFRATLFAKTGRANWLVGMHQDTVLPLAQPIADPAWTGWSKKAGVHCANGPPHVLAQIVALRIHLDPSGEDNGPLRVIPGSHTVGVLSADGLARLRREQCPIPVLVGRGGVLALRPLLVHGSSRCRDTHGDPRPRRVLHIEYTPQLEWPGLGGAEGPPARLATV